MGDITVPFGGSTHVPSQNWSRRGLLGAAAALGTTAALGGTAAFAGAPGLVRRGRPVLTHGVQTGDAFGGAANVWTRADRAGRMLVEVSDRPDLRHARTVLGPRLGPGTDFTGRARLRGLRSGARTYYRVRVVGDHGAASEPLIGSLSVPGTRDDLSFVWTGDIAGQGWGINPDIGGMRIFEAMRRVRPDFYLCSGDTVYADGPLTESVTLPDGRVWRNVVTPEKSKVAETLAEYRGQFAYNLLDANVRRFLAEVPQLNQWDDHEVTQQLVSRRDPRRRPLHREAGRRAGRPQRARRSSSGRRSRRAALPQGLYGPLLDVFVLDMRTYKDANDGNVYADPRRGLLGETQRPWLTESLRRSTATWKVIANDLPLGLVVPDGPAAQEGVAQGDDGAPRGREIEFAEHPAGRAPARGDRRRARDRRRPLHGGAPLRPGPGRRRRLHAVLGVRLGTGQRRRVRAERAGRHVRPHGRVRARAAGGQHVAA